MNSYPNIGYGDNAELLRSEILEDPELVGYPEWDGEEATAKEIIGLLVKREQILNPDPAPKIPIPMTIAGVFGVLSDSGKNTIKEFGPQGQDPIRTDVKNGDREAVAMWALINLSPEDAQSVSEYLQSTIDDPDHPETITAQSRLTQVCGIGGVSVEEITSILNQGE